jgi:hypothetical protein
LLPVAEARVALTGYLDGFKEKAAAATAEVCDSLGSIGQR